MAKRGKTREIPNRMNIAYGELSVSRGSTVGDTPLTIVAWDAVGNCIPEECVVTDFCDYVRGGKCSLQLTYLKSVSNMIFRTYIDKLDEGELFKIGMHLIPVYKHLCRMKMEEMSILNIMAKTEKGGVRVHPIYREIRETIKLLETLWKNLGLSPIPVLDPNMGKGIGKGGSWLEGDPNAYANMTGTKKAKVPKKKLQVRKDG